jgi:amino acid transporter
MPSLPSALVAIAVLAVFAALLLGFVNLSRLGAGERSQRLMRWRVGLQVVAIAIVVVVLLTRTHH